MRCFFVALVSLSATSALAEDASPGAAATPPAPAGAESTPPAASPTAPKPAADRGQGAQVDNLVAVLTTEDSFKLRLQAAVMLGRIGDERAVRPLMNALTSDPHYTVRAASATALANLKEPRAVTQILERIALDPEPFVREEAQRALSKYERQVALPYAVASFSSPSAQVRKQALSYIAQEANIMVEPVLAKALGDVPEIFAIAKDAIRKLPETELMPFLDSAAGHRDAAVRRGAVLVLRELGTPDAAQLALKIYERDIEDDDVKATARSTLRELRQHLPVVQIVRDATTGSSEKHTRARALRLLGVIGGDEAEKVLSQGLKDEDPYIRGNAVMAIGELGNSEFVPVLEALIADPANQRIVHLVRHTLKQLRNNKRDQSGH